MDGKIKSWPAACLFVVVGCGWGGTHAMENGEEKSGVSGRWSAWLEKGGAGRDLPATVAAAADGRGDWEKLVVAAESCGMLLCANVLARHKESDLHAERC
jgi:hypothetical protein